MKHHFHLLWKMNCLGHLIIVLVVPCVCHLDHVVDDGDNHHHHHHQHNHQESNFRINSTAMLNDPVQRIFERYGHDGVITREDFRLFLKSLGLDVQADESHGDAAIAKLLGIDPIVNEKKLFIGGLNNSLTKTMHSHRTSGTENNTLVNPQSLKCLSLPEILWSSNIDPSRESIMPQDFTPLCPVILYELGQEDCVNHDHDHGSFKDDVLILPTNIYDSHAFLYSSLAVLIISVSGILCVGIIPILQRFFYQHFMHFFIALAIGSLTGDALLHLLPHAMDEVSMNEHGGSDCGHSHGKLHAHSSHRTIWIGLTTLGGICMFYVLERIITALKDWRQQGLPTITVSALNDGTPNQADDQSQTNGHNEINSEIIPGLTKVAPLTEDDTDVQFAMENGQKPLKRLCHTSSAPMPAEIPLMTIGGIHVSPSMKQHIKRTNSYNASVSPRRRSSVIRTMHDVKHHGHGHSHAHEREVPTTASAMVWMVIAGDGLHNFSDGMAIGAAFARSSIGGLSTSIAVFCHELPHELGDFALLLKAGMKIRQALLYNTLSSILCFFGMLVGLLIGNLSMANAWVFAAVAGMFLYIALVDMVPELNSDNSLTFGGTMKFTIQALGIGTGVLIMGIIAVYEHDLQSILDS